MCRLRPPPDGGKTSPSPPPPHPPARPPVFHHGMTGNLVKHRRVNPPRLTVLLTVNLLQDTMEEPTGDDHYDMDLKEEEEEEEMMDDDVGDDEEEEDDDGHDPPAPNDGEESGVGEFLDYEPTRDEIWQVRFRLLSRHGFSRYHRGENPVFRCHEIPSRTSQNTPKGISQHSILAKE